MMGKLLKNANGLLYAGLFRPADNRADAIAGTVPLDRHEKTIEAAVFSRMLPS